MDSPGNAFLAEARSRLVKRELQKQQGQFASSYHSWDPKEPERYAERINSIMQGEPDWTPLPINQAALFSMASDGRTLCRLMNKCQPHAIPESLIKTQRNSSAAASFVNNELLNAFIVAASSAGLVVGNIGSGDFLRVEEENKEHLILGVVWQLLRRQLANEIKSILSKEMTNNGEFASASEKLSFNVNMANVLKDPESYLCQWVNDMLKERNVKLPQDGRGAMVITDLSTVNSDALPQLVHILHSSETSASGITTDDPVARANIVVEWAQENNIPFIAHADDLHDTNPRLIMPFVMSLFTYYHTHKALMDAHNQGDANLTDVSYVLQVARISEYAKGVVAFRKSEDAYRYAIPENIVSLCNANVPDLDELEQNAEGRDELKSDEIREILGDLYSLVVTCRPLAEAVANKGSGAIGSVDAEIRQKAKVAVDALEAEQLPQINETLTSLLDIYTSYHVESLKLY